VETVQQVDYSRKWYVMAAVAMGIFLATVDGSIVNITLPTLVNAFQVDFAVVEWVVLSYLLAVTTLMLGIGRLADMLGKKMLYNTGFIIFTVGSLLCGLASTVYLLIAFRVLQAIGAAMTMALGTAIVTEAFPPQERGKALGITGLMVSLGVITGPTLGGIILEAASWHWVFFVNLPFGVVGTLLVARFVPALRPQGGQRFDYWGALTLFAGLMSFLLALTFGQQDGFGAPASLALFAAAAVGLAAFVVIELRSEQPMIDLSLFRNGLFSVNLITGFMTFVASAGTVLLMPFYLQNVLGHSPRTAGLLMVVVPVALGIFAPLSGILSDRFGTRPLTVVGLALLLVGYLAVSTLSTETSMWGYVLRFLPVGIGMGMFQSPNNSAIMGSVPRERLGVASGLLAITRTLGQTTGIAVLGALWSGRVFAYAGQVYAGGATSAPAAFQVAGLQDSVLIMCALVLAGLGLSVWALLQESRQGAALRASVRSSEG